MDDSEEKPGEAVLSKPKRILGFEFLETLAPPKHRNRSVGQLRSGRSDTLIEDDGNRNSNSKEQDLNANVFLGQRRSADTKFDQANIVTEASIGQQQSYFQPSVLQKQKIAIVADLDFSKPSQIHSSERKEPYQTESKFLQSNPNHNESIQSPNSFLALVGGPKRKEQLGKPPPSLVRKEADDISATHSSSGSKIIQGTTNKGTRSLQNVKDEDSLDMLHKPKSSTVSSEEIYKNSPNEANQPETTNKSIKKFKLSKYELNGLWDWDYKPASPFNFQDCQVDSGNVDALVGHVLQQSIPKGSLLFPKKSAQENLVLPLEKNPLENENEKPQFFPGININFNYNSGLPPLPPKPQKPAEAAAAEAKPLPFSYFRPMQIPQAPYSQPLLKSSAYFPSKSDSFLEQQNHSESDEMKDPIINTQTISQIPSKPSLPHAAVVEKIGTTSLVDQSETTPPGINAKQNIENETPVVDPAPIAVESERELLDFSQYLLNHSGPLTDMSFVCDIDTDTRPAMSVSSNSFSNYSNQHKKKSSRKSPGKKSSMERIELLSPLGVRIFEILNRFNKLDEQDQSLVADVERYACGYTDDVNHDLVWEIRKPSPQQANRPPSMPRSRSRSRSRSSSRSIREMITSAKKTEYKPPKPSKTKLSGLVEGGRNIVQENILMAKFPKNRVSFRTLPTYEPPKPIDFSHQEKDPTSSRPKTTVPCSSTCKSPKNLPQSAQSSKTQSQRPLSVGFDHPHMFHILSHARVGTSLQPPPSSPRPKSRGRSGAKTSLTQPKEPPIPVRQHNVRALYEELSGRKIPLLPSPYRNSKVIQAIRGNLKSQSPRVRFETSEDDEVTPGRFVTVKSRNRPVMPLPNINLGHVQAAFRYIDRNPRPRIDQANRNNSLKRQSSLMSDDDDIFY